MPAEIVVAETMMLTFLMVNELKFLLLSNRAAKCTCIVFPLN